MILIFRFWLILVFRSQLANDDNLMRVRVVESGEELDYRFADILDDPKERECLLPASNTTTKRLVTP